MSEPQVQPGQDDGAGAATGWSWGEQSGPPGYGPPTPPQYGAPGYGPQHGAPAPPQYGPPQYGPPQYGAPQYGAPQYGAPQYGQPQYGQPQYGAPQYGQPQYGAPAGYVPAPIQRGVIPLRPLSLGEIYDGAFRSIRANPRVMFGFSAVVVAVAAVIGGIVWWLVVPSVAAFIDSSFPDEFSTAGEEEFLASVYSMYSMLPFLILAAIVLTGVLTVSVSRSVIGQNVTVAELWRSHWKRVLMVGAYTLLQGVGIVALALVYLFLVGAATAVSGALAALVGVLGAIGLVVGLFWLTVRLLFVPPVLMLEGQSFFSSITRGWRLTRGSFWRILGIYLLAQVIAQVVSQVLSVPTSVIAVIIAGNDADGLASGGYIATMTIGMAIAYVIPSIFMAAVVALQYIDVRIRKEGLDVQLARAAEANAAKVA